MISERLSIFSGVAGAHLLALALIVMAPGQPVTPPVELPVVQGVLVSSASATAPQPARPEAPRQKSVPSQQSEPPLPAPAPRPEPVAAQPAPQPAPPQAPPSERAISAPPPDSKPQGKAAPLVRSAPSNSAVAGPPPEQGAPKTAAAPTGTGGAPLSLPRVDAGQLGNPVPEYPPASRRLGEQGKVLLDLLILPDGSVGEIRLRASSRYPRLDNAALSAVKKWRYLPARRGTTPIAFWYVQPVVFALQN